MTDGQTVKRLPRSQPPLTQSRSVVLGTSRSHFAFADGLANKGGGSNKSRVSAGEKYCSYDKLSKLTTNLILQSGLRNDF